jgi:chromate transporter
MNNKNKMQTTDQSSVITVFLTFLRLGLTSFGGPVAHLGYFHDEFVVRRKWLDERAYADLVALCQFLPGPASSQVGIGVGLSRAGLPGAVAVVAQAVWGMAQNLCPDAKRASLAVLATIGVLAVPSPFVQVGAIVIGGIVGWAMLRADTPTDHVDLGVRVPRVISITALLLFFAGLIGLPLFAAAYPSQTMALVDSFYRSGSLVFGGGHVVMPLLQAEVVPSGWVSKDAFLAGYGAAQAVPGPLFTFAAYLGTVMTGAPNGIVGGLICLLAIFASSFLLVIGVLPFWDSLRRIGSVRNALQGVNAVVVGLLLAALYDPVWTSAILSAADFGLALAAFTLLVFWKTPAWLVVILTACGGWALHTAVML